MFQQRVHPPLTPKHRSKKPTDEKEKGHSEPVDDIKHQLKAIRGLMEHPRIAIIGNNPTRHISQPDMQSDPQQHRNGAKCIEIMAACDISGGRLTQRMVTFIVLLSFQIREWSKQALLPIIMP